VLRRSDEVREVDIAGEFGADPFGGSGLDESMDKGAEGLLMLHIS